MPLDDTCSLEAFHSNVAEMVSSGHPQDQAVAAAASQLRKSCGAARADAMLSADRGDVETLTTGLKAKVASKEEGAVERLSAWKDKQLALCGDVAGHEFHGNQYSEIHGDKPMKERQKLAETAKEEGDHMEAADHHNERSEALRHTGGSMKTMRATYQAAEAHRAAAQAHAEIAEREMSGGKATPEERSEAHRLSRAAHSDEEHAQTVAFIEHAKAMKKRLG